MDPQEDRMTNSFSDVKDRDLQTPMSAGYLHKKTFFPPLAHKSRLMLRRSESERKLPAPVKYERGGGEAPLTGINTAVSHQNYPHTKPELHGYYIAKLNELYYILVSSYRYLHVSNIIFCLSTHTVHMRSPLEERHLAARLHSVP